jgi:nitroreductase
LTQHTIKETALNRYSPYAFSGAPIANDDLRDLFEAARWAPSCYNEQPWRFIVGRKGEDIYDEILSTLVDANAAWAQKAPVLVIAVASTSFERNGKENRHARYDLGQAVATLSLVAWSKGIALHQMAGFSTEEAAKRLQLPDGIEAVTAIAIGHPADLDSLDDESRQKEQRPRNRRELSETVFNGPYGAPADFI